MTSTIVAARHHSSQEPFSFFFFFFPTFVYFPCDTGNGVLFHPEKNLSVLPRMNFQGIAGGERAGAVAASFRVAL